MFESTLEAQGLHHGERRLGTLSAAVLAHAGIVLSIALVTAAIVPPVHGPDTPRPIVAIAAEIPLGDLTPHRPSVPKGTEGTKSGRAIAPQPVVPHDPPKATPDVPLAPADDDSSTGPEGPGDGTTGGPNGSPLGVPGGTGDGGPGPGEGPGVEPVYVTGEMEKPVLLVKVEPVYPEAARLARLGGRVTIMAVIGEDGGIVSAEVLASKNPLFNGAALEAVRRWRYRPALMNGRPVRVYFTVMVDFVMR